MVITTGKIYHCDHCKRKMLGASAMSQHEKYCKNNPSNKHKCFEFCMYLVKDKKEIKNRYYEGSFRFVTSFHCSKRNDIELYSYKFEKYRHRPDLLNGMERMPLECKEYKEMDFDTMDGTYIE